jgi:hypothetical protein
LTGRMSLSMTCPVSRSITLNRGDPAAREPRCWRIVNPSFRAWDRRCGVGAVDSFSTGVRASPVCFRGRGTSVSESRATVISVRRGCLPAAQRFFIKTGLTQSCRGPCCWRRDGPREWLSGWDRCERTSDEIEVIRPRLTCC